MNKSILTLVLLTLCVVPSACTTTHVDIKRLSSDHKIDSMCIKENKKVIVKEFLTLLQDGFNRHQIQTKIYEDELPSTCEYTVYYNANGKWDLYLYLSTAWIEIRRNNEIIAHANYRGPSGLNPEKRQSSKSKIDPVIDDLLRNYSSK